MKYSQTNSSSFRYFLARFKPFGNFMFWGPLTILGLLSFAIWQYSNHPEWLSGIREQLPTLEDSYVENQTNLPTNPQLKQPLGQQNSNLLYPQSNNSNQLAPFPSLKKKNEANTQKINSDLTNSDQQQKSSLFKPLFPNVKSDNSLVESSSIKPVKPTLIPGENHLQQAIENKTKAGSNPNYATSSETLPDLNINNRSSFSKPGVSQQLTNNNNFVQPVQPSIQPYQVPYNNYSPQPQPQQIQSQPAPYQVPYNNYPTQPQTNSFSGQSNPTGQGTSVPSNGYSPPSPQIQPSIRENSY